MVGTDAHKHRYVYKLKRPYSGRHTFRLTQQTYRNDGRPRESKEKSKMLAPLDQLTPLGKYFDFFLSKKSSESYW